jgi:hypothetical protein
MSIQLLLQLPQQSVVCLAAVVYSVCEREEVFEPGRMGESEQLPTSLPACRSAGDFNAGLLAPSSEQQAAGL